MTKREAIVVTVAAWVMGVALYFIGYYDGKNDYKCHPVGGGLAITAEGKRGGFQMCKVNP